MFSHLALMALYCFYRLIKKMLQSFKQEVISAANAWLKLINAIRFITALDWIKSA